MKLNKCHKSENNSKMKFNENNESSKNNNCDKCRQESNLKRLFNKTKSGLSTVKVRLFLTINLTIILIVLFIILVNNFALENFYSFSKVQKLKEVYNRINDYYNNPNNDKDLEEELEKISIKNNFDILIKDDNGISVYTTNSKFTTNTNELEDLLSEMPRGKQIEINEKYSIDKNLDERRRNFIHNAFW